MITLYIVIYPLGASIVFILIHAAMHSVLPQDGDEGEIEVTMEEVTIQWSHTISRLILFFQFKFFH